jgi:hypothetical protein
MARPSPVPPWRRVVDVSACSKAWNSCAAGARARCRCRCRAPRSAAAAVLASWRCCRSQHCSTMLPRSVNLLALFSRFSSACDSRVGSPRSRSGTSPVSRPAPRPWPARASATSSTTREQLGRASKSTCSSSSRPASILDRSRMSLMIASRCCAASSIAPAGSALRAVANLARAAGASGRRWRSSACGSRGSCWPGRRSWPGWRRRRGRARRPVPRSAASGPARPA